MSKSFNLSKFIGQLLVSNPFLFSNNVTFMNFFKEGMLLDFLQKKSIDVILKKLLIGTTQLFNFSFLNNTFIFFLFNGVLLPLNIKFFKEQSLTIYGTLINLIFFLF